MIGFIRFGLLVLVVLPAFGEECRASQGYFSREEFETWTCSLCYVYLFACHSCPRSKTILYSSRSLHTNLSQSLNLFDNENVEYKPDKSLCQQFLRNQEECDEWQECCEAGKKCCERQREQEIRKNVTGQCPMTWDGVDCWDSAEAGTVLHEPCPSYYVHPRNAFFRAQSSKQCTEQAQWWPQSGSETTDYKDCLIVTNMSEIIKASIYVGFVGYGLSLLALVAAGYILIAVPSLRREEQARYRYKLHMNLFTSFILLGILSIVLDSEHYLKGINDPQDRLGDTSCRILTVLQWYARGATYWWLFGEGLFLHRRLRNWASADCPESLVKYYVMGWGFPALPTLVWMILHVVNKDPGCWGGDADSDLRFINLVPNLVCLFMTLIMLLDIQRMIMTTVRQARNEPMLVVARQGFRATVTLIPLFGLQTLLTTVRLEWWYEWDIFEKLLVSTQGLCVACLYCLTKREVRHEVKRAFRQRQLMRASFSTSNATQSTRFSTNSIDDSKGNSLSMQTVVETRSGS